MALDAKWEGMKEAASDFKNGAADWAVGYRLRYLYLKKFGALIAEYFCKDSCEGLPGEAILTDIGFSVKSTMNQEELNNYRKMVNLAVEYIVMLMNIIMYSPNIMEAQRQGNFQYEVVKGFLGRRRVADRTGLMLLEYTFKIMREKFNVGDGLLPCKVSYYSDFLRDTIISDKAHGYVFFDGYESLKKSALPEASYIRKLVNGGIDSPQEMFGEGVKVYPRGTITAYDEILQKPGIIIQF